MEKERFVKCAKCLGTGARKTEPNTGNEEKGICFTCSGTGQIAFMHYSLLQLNFSESFEKGKYTLWLSKILNKLESISVTLVRNEGVLEIEKLVFVSPATTEYFARINSIESLVIFLQSL